MLRRGRGNTDGVLHVTGRDVDEAEHAMTFQPADGAWRLLDGPAERHTMSDTRATIARYLDATGPAAPKGIAYATGLAYEQVKKTCQRMAADGQLHSDTAGRYRTTGGDGDNTPGSVPGVPRVPQPSMSSTNTVDQEGQFGDNVVPVPERIEEGAVSG